MSSFLFADNYESLQNATNKKQQLEKAQETLKIIMLQQVFMIELRVFIKHITFYLQE